MSSVFLSPSTQEFNPYVIGGNEELYMNQIADAMVPYLLASGIEVGRNNPDESLSAAIAASNAGNYDLHLALHSNSSPESLSGQLQGPDVYYYATSVKGRDAATIIANNLKWIYPDPSLVNTVPNTTLAELRRVTAPSVLVEIAYHDNYADAVWIRDNIQEIAYNLSVSVADFLDVQFMEP
jgi:N-acetylmuramoyl-L-alanine amidase